MLDAYVPRETCRLITYAKTRHNPYNRKAQLSVVQYKNLNTLRVAREQKAVLVTPRATSH